MLHITSFPVSHHLSCVPNFRLSHLVLACFDACSIQHILTSAFAGVCSGSGEDDVSEQFIAAGQPLLTKADAEQPMPAKYLSTAQAAVKPTYRRARRNSSFKILRVQARARIVRLLLQEKFPALPIK